MVNIRILGYLLAFVPADTARKHVVGEILADRDRGSDALINWGGYCDRFFLRPCQFPPHGLVPRVARSRVTAD